MEIDFTKSLTKDRRADFAQYLKDMQRRIGFKVSSRGWCYLLETDRIINKDQFDKVEEWINKCRKTGDIPVDFVAEEDARKFSGVEIPTPETPVEYFGSWLHYALTCHDMYKPDWWDGEQYYIQVVVEKVDLKTLFGPVCQKYHIPIANSKGWSSVLQRAEFARRFQEAEKDGLQCILLYCGDHDPDGLRISDFLRQNLEDLKEVQWADGSPGYDPKNLIVERFGLSADFIEQHRLTWIDNLITGSKKNLASPKHRNHFMPYVQEYLASYGVRKCEANAIVTIPTAARNLIDSTILNYLGSNARERFSQKAELARQEIDEFQEKFGVKEILNEMIEEAQQYSA